MKKIWSGSFRRRLFWAFLAAAMIPLLLCAGSLLQIFRLFCQCFRLPLPYRR